MEKPQFWERAKKDLIKKDKKLAKIIQNYPNDFLFTKSDPFYTLARSIVGQQISVKAAQAVWVKFERKIKNVSPLRVLKLHHMTLKSCGLSRQKISYLKSLSNAFIEKKVEPKKWTNFTDDEIIANLESIKGIGKWTAQMLFCIRYPSIRIF